MNSTDIFTQVLLRLLPSLVLLALGFFAATDRKTREQWANILYQMGSIRPDQREDPKIQQGVRLPFLILGGLLLLWPIYYYWWITRPIEVIATVYQTKPPATTTNSVTNNPAATSGTPGAPPGTTIYGTPAAGAPATGTPAAGTSIYGTPAPGAPQAASPRTNIYGTPLAP